MTILVFRYYSLLKQILSVLYLHHAPFPHYSWWGAFCFVFLGEAVQWEDRSHKSVQILFPLAPLVSHERAGIRGWDVAQLVRASDRHAADAGSILRCGKGFSSQSQLSVQTLCRCPYTPRVPSHALTSARTIQIP